MFVVRLNTPRPLVQALSQRARCRPATRGYAADNAKRTEQMMKTSSRLTWLTTTAAAGAAALYYTTSSTSTSADAASVSNPPAAPAAPNNSGSSQAAYPGHRREAAYASDVPKPVEDRHGDSVGKHSIAAHKNQNKLRVGKFSGKEFDNHDQKHSPGDPDADFEKREK